MGKRVKIVWSDSDMDMQATINKELIDGWLPHWDTFKIDRRDGCMYFCIILEKNIEDIK